MIGFLRCLFGKKEKNPTQIEAMRSVAERYPNTLKSLADSEAREAKTGG